MIREPVCSGKPNCGCYKCLPLPCRHPNIRFNGNEIGVCVKCGRAIPQSRDDVVMWRIPGTDTAKFIWELTQEEAITIGTDMRKELKECKKLLVEMPDNPRLQFYMPQMEETMRSFENLYRQRWMQPHSQALMCTK